MSQAIPAESFHVGTPTTVESPHIGHHLGGDVGEIHKSIINALPGAVLLLDNCGVIATANPTAHDWLGEPLQGEHWRTVCQREFSANFNRGELTTRDNRLLNISTQPLSDRPGQIVLLSDVTESRALQELSERNARLASIGEMMARLSHQIRTPISTAMLYLSYMQTDTGDHACIQQSRFAQKSLGRLRHVESMIRNMLMFAHGAHMEKEMQPLGVIIRDLITQLAPLLETVGARYRLRCDTSEQVYANRTGIVIAMLNVCSNAIQTVGETLELTITSRASNDDYLIVDIADNGPGIPLALRERVFQPFYTSRGDGTGLGLSVVKSIVDAHGGHIDVLDSPAGGALFSFSIPTKEQECRGAPEQAVA